MRTFAILAILGGSAIAAAADAPPSSADVTQVVGVFGTTCTLHMDGAVSCWGGNDNRQLGTADTKPRYVPIDVPALRGAVQIAGVRFGVCGRFSEGTVKCLGFDQNAPAGAAKQPLADVVELRGECARMKSGKVACVEGRSNKWTEVAGVSDATGVDGQLEAGCVLHPDATVSCWGNNLRGGASLGANADGSVKRIDGVSKVVEVSAGMFHACARHENGGVSCWGTNVDGELGRGKVDTMSDYKFFSAARVVGLSDATRVFGMPGSTCAIRKTGALVCWGEFFWRRGDSVKDRFAKPVAIAGVSGVRDFMASDHFCAVGKGRKLWCWGDGRYGQLGNGYGERLAEARDVPAIRDAVDVHAMALGTCVLRKTGALKCFGTNFNRPGGAPPLASVSSFHSRVTGLDRAGKLWVWGDKAASAIAGSAHAGGCVVTKQGKVTCRAAVMYQGARTGTVGKVTDAVEVAGESSICIRHKTGRISCLSIVSALGGREPEPVPTIDDAVAIATSDREACAVRGDRSVWCWGDGTSQFLGAQPDASNASPRPGPIAPFKVQGVSDVVQVALGDSTNSSQTACAVTTQGRVTCWGAPGDKTYRGVVDGTKPVDVGGITDAVRVSVGWLHACAVRKTGAVACWGQTGNGQSGTLPMENVETPQLLRWP